MASADSAATPAGEPIPEDLADLNLLQLLDALEPVPKPEPISLWPQTPLWGWMAVLLLLVAAYFSYRYWQRWRANAYRRAALAEIAHAGDDPAALSSILRRTALCAFPRETVASLYGAEWLKFLEQHCPGAGFESDIGRALIRGPYDPSSPAATGGLADLAAHWVRKHRRPETGQPS